MPWHPPVCCLVEVVTLPLGDILKIHDAIIVKVLAGPYLLCDVGRVGIRQWVLMHIPSPETQIETTDEGKLVVDHEELFMMCPKKRWVRAVNKRVMVGMAHHRDVAVSLVAART
jgi:hypothetical protein